MMMIDDDDGSVGCIFGELLTGKPMFRGENDIKQLEAIFKVVKGRG